MYQGNFIGGLNYFFYNSMCFATFVNIEAKLGTNKHGVRFALQLR